MKINSYQDLIVWQKAVELVVEIYKLTKNFPKSETYGLISQMRRAAVAIPSNIAEGYRRRHTKEYLQFLSVANGSAAELETQIIVAKQLEETKKLNFQKASSLLEEVLKILNVLISNLSKQKNINSPLHPTPHCLLPNITP